MARYVKKPIEVDAIQWFENGDHPEDDSQTVQIDFHSHLIEGKVVRRFRRPDQDGRKECEKCGKILHVHGWIETLEGGHIVCPGDFIITGIKGEYYPCKPDVFKETYNKI